MTDEEMMKKSDVAFAALQKAISEAIDRKRRLGQYWVVADADGKPIKVYPENPVDPIED